MPLCCFPALACIDERTLSAPKTSYAHSNPVNTKVNVLAFVESCVGDIIAISLSLQSAAPSTRVRRAVREHRDGKTTNQEFVEFTSRIFDPVEHEPRAEWDKRAAWWVKKLADFVSQNSR